MVTDAALADAVGPDVLDRARQYVARAVLDVRVAEDARRVTGLTPEQHRQVTRAIKNAREMALLPYSSSAR